MKCTNIDLQSKAYDLKQYNECTRRAGGLMNVYVRSCIGKTTPWPNSPHGWLYSVLMRFLFHTHSRHKQPLDLTFSQEPWYQLFYWFSREFLDGVLKDYVESNHSMSLPLGSFFRMEVMHLSYAWEMCPFIPPETRLLAGGWRLIKESCTTELRIKVVQWGFEPVHSREFDAHQTPSETHLISWSR